MSEATESFSMCALAETSLKAETPCNSNKNIGNSWVYSSIKNNRRDATTIIRIPAAALNYSAYSSDIFLVYIPIFT
jgi:hypothetical protein